MKTKPTRAQIAALHLISKGGAYRSARAFANSSVHAGGDRIAPGTVAVLVRNGWAAWGDEVSLKQPLFLTDAGRTHLPTHRATE